MMKRIWTLLIFVLLAAVLCACGAQMPEEEIPVGADTGLMRTGIVYGTDGTYLVPVSVSVGLGDGCAEATLRKMQQLSQEADGLSAVIPEDVILSVSQEDGIATVELSGETSGIDAEQAVASIVNTLTQFGGIDAVSFRVNGDSEKFGSVDISEPIRTVNLNPAYDPGELTPFQVCFQNEAGQIVPVTKATDTPTAEVFIRAMMNVPKGADGLSGLFPTGTELRSAVLTDGTLALDFSEELYAVSAVPEAQEKLMSAIAAVCAQLEGVEDVEVFVNGMEFCCERV